MKQAQNGNEQLPPDTEITIHDFVSHLPSRRYIFIPNGEPWPASAVNLRVEPQGKIAASTWLDRHRAVEAMSWVPGEPMLIHNRLVSGDGIIERKDVVTFNLYRPATILPGRPDLAQPWLDHVLRVYPDEHGHILRWLSHRVQMPWSKINHALVLGGSQGIGKDTLLSPVRLAVGPWNFSDISPAHLLGRFNPHAKSVILRCSEARDLGEVSKYAFYDHCKIYSAAPPETLLVDEKNLRSYRIPNVCGLIITTNHRDGLYLPGDDRRHYVCWSPRVKEDFPQNYWADLHRWYQSGGNEHVTAFLAKNDISDFDPGEPPAKTAAFWDMVAVGTAPEDGEFADLLDEMGNPPAITLAELVASANGREIYGWLTDRKNRRAVPHRMESCAYRAIRNPFADDGLWKISGRRQMIYARMSLDEPERLRAAQELANQ